MVTNRDKDIQREKFHTLVLEKFPCGMRPTSLIDRRKFRKFFEEKYFHSFFISEDDIGGFTELAEVACVNVGGKFYAIPSPGLKNLSELLLRLKHRGTNTIFFSLFYKANIGQFMEWGFLSPDILSKVIKKYFSYFCGDNFFCLQDNISLDEEIILFCNGKYVIHIDEFLHALPYIIPEKIKEILKNSPKILQIGTDRFIHLDSIIFEKSEEDTIKSNIINSIAKHGFFLGKNLHFHYSQELNAEVPPQFLAKIFVMRCLSNNYIWQNGIICTKDKPFTPDALLRLFCQNAKSFTLDDLIHLMDNLSESCDNSHLLMVARNLSVQVDEKNFVEPTAVDFDVPATDEALAFLTSGNPLPLRTITLSLLPAVPGYTWNHYLLLSYCHLKSKKFQALQLSSSNACTGIIFSRHLEEKNYYKIAAQIVLDKGVAMRFDDVADFVLQYGLVARRRKSAISNILAAMRQIKA